MIKPELSSQLSHVCQSPGFPPKPGPGLQRPPFEKQWRVGIHAVRSSAPRCAHACNQSLRVNRPRSAHMGNRKVPRLILLLGDLGYRSVCRYLVRIRPGVVPVRGDLLLSVKTAAEQEYAY